MRLHRFYIEKPIDSDSFDVSDKDLVHQWKNVFRYNVGSQVIIFDGFGFDYLCIISSLRSLGATLNVVRKTKNKFTPKTNLWLCLGVIKKDNFDLVVEKATELGVSNIVPVLCERTEKKNINLERLRKISIEASEQSGRGNVPKIHEMIPLSKLLDTNILPDRAFFLDPGADKNIKDFVGLEELVVFVGPEGGFTPDEIKSFKDHNIFGVSLGSQVLRSETASIAVSSIVLI